MEPHLYFILLAVIFLLFIISLFHKSNLRKLPPGPVGFPIVGSLPQLGSKVHESRMQSPPSRTPSSPSRGFQVTKYGATAVVLAPSMCSHVAASTLTSISGTRRYSNSSAILRKGI